MPRPADVVSAVSVVSSVVSVIVLVVSVVGVVVILVEVLFRSLPAPLPPPQEYSANRQDRINVCRIKVARGLFRCALNNAVWPDQRWMSGIW